MKGRTLGGLTLILVVLVALLLPATVMFAEDQGQNGTTLSADVSLNLHWTRTVQWTIDKSADKTTIDQFRGDSSDVNYTVAVTKTGYVDKAWASGQVCVTNGGGVATEGLAIVLRLKNGLPPPNDQIATANVDVSGHPVLQPGESWCYDYKVTIPSNLIHAGGTYKATADVTITNHSGYLGEPFGPSPSATDVMPAEPTLVNGTIHVTDTNGGSWTFSNTGSVSYKKTFTCDADEGSHKNTATITETGQSDSVTVMVNCYALGVKKTANTSLTRTYDWQLTKSVSDPSLTLAVGEKFQVTYTVGVKTTGYTDSNWKAAGQIEVTNPAPIAATLTSVTDVISGGIEATVDCPVTFPYTLGAGQTLTCTYKANLPDAAARTNTATATLQNKPSGTTNFTGTAAVSFASPTIKKVDECIDVSDSYAGSLGRVCVVDSPKTFTYTRWIGPYEECGQYSVDNTATAVTVDLGRTLTAEAAVDITVPCQGCTLTQGYWKTHSKYGPAPYDDTWAKVGEDTLFFSTLKTWFQVFWTPPAGNVFWSLAHQYMAAKLNQLNGAYVPSNVATAMTHAEYLFGKYWNVTMDKSVRADFVATASLLEQYNSGAIGPGHCSE